MTHWSTTTIWLALLCSLPAACQNATHEDSNNQAVQGFIATFDWLVATNGSDEFSEPLLTLNQADLERFIPTGSVTQKFELHNLLLENRQGIYYSNQDNSDTSLDVPASVSIKVGDKYIGGAKGLYFTTKLTLEHILIEHWNGLLGCTIARWYLSYELTPTGVTAQLQVINTEYADFLSTKKCTPIPAS